MSQYRVFVNCNTGCVAKLTDIVPHPSYCRRWAVEEVHAMANSLVSVGYFNPIVVCKVNDLVTCVDGHLRLIALRSLAHLESHNVLKTTKYEIPDRLPVVLVTKVDVRGLLELGHRCFGTPAYFTRYYQKKW